MTTREEECRELAENLITSLGPLRAAHVARQYGWRDVAGEILARVERRPNSGQPTIDFNGAAPA